MEIKGGKKTYLFIFSIENKPTDLSSEMEKKQCLYKLATAGEILVIGGLIKCVIGPVCCSNFHTNSSVLFI